MVFEPQKAAVRFVGVLPPPHTGMTAVSDAMHRCLSQRFELRTVSTRRTRPLGDTVWSVRKHLALTIGLFRELIVRPGASPIYMVLDAGSGAWGSALLALLARLAGAPLIVHHHVFSYFTHSSRAARLFFAAAGARAVHITLCGCMRDSLRTRYGEDRQVVVLSNPAFVQLEGSPRPRDVLTRVGFLGNVTREKGVGLFMETVRELHRRGLHVEASIAGPVRDETLREEIEAFVNEDASRRAAVGAVYGADKQRFLDGIDLLLFPSQYVNEAQPVTIYEGLASGAPVLATQRGCVGEQLPADWVFPEDDYVFRAADQITRWSSDRSLYAAAAALAGQTWQTAMSRSREELDNVLNVVDALARHNAIEA